MDHRHGDSVVAAVVARARRLQQYLWHEPNPVVQIFYLLLVVGGYGAFLVTGLPLLLADDAPLSQSHILVSCLVVSGAMYSFISASTSTSGILLPQTTKFYDNYEYDGIMYQPHRNCRTCKTPKIARSKHCSFCNVCVPRFDHHCVWLNACIGERNHKQFMAFVLANLVMCAYGSYVLFHLLHAEFVKLKDEQFVEEDSGQVIKGVTLVVYRYLVHAESVLVTLWALCTFMGLAVLLFFLFHCYLVASNYTTNEFFKWRALKRERRRGTRQRPSEREDPTTVVVTKPLRHIYGLSSLKENVMEIMKPRCDARLEEFIRLRKLHKQS